MAGLIGGGILTILLLLVWLGCAVCFVMVVIKQFKDAGPVHGIIGIVTCGFWTLIWGWMNGKRLDITKIMLAWTVLIVIGIILYIVGFAGVIAAGGMK